MGNGSPLRLNRRFLVTQWGAVALWMAGIFYLSSRSQPLGPVSRSRHSGSIRDVAHFVEYAGLVILLYRALSNSDKAQTTSSLSDPPDSLNTPLATNSNITTASAHPSFISFAIALGYAIFDELHQALVPGRGFEMTDVGYDLAGIIAALALVRLRNNWMARGKD